MKTSNHTLSKNVHNEYLKPHIAKNVRSEYFKPQNVENVFDSFVLEIRIFGAQISNTVSIFSKILKCYNFFSFEYFLMSPRNKVCEIASATDCAHQNFVLES